MNIDENGEPFHGLPASYPLLPKQMSFDATWKDLSVVVDAILQDNASAIPKKQWDASFSDVYHLCNSIPEPFGPKLYGVIEDKFISHVDLLHKQLERYNGRQYQEFLISAHKSIRKAAESLNHFFTVLNQQVIHEAYAVSMQEILGDSNTAVSSLRLEIRGLLLEHWRNDVLAPAAKRVVLFAQEHFNNRRRHLEVANTDLLKASIALYYDVELTSVLTGANAASQYRTLVEGVPPDSESVLEFYRTHIERPIEEHSIKYYTETSAEWNDVVDVSKYIERVALLIEDEKRIAAEFLHQTTVDKINVWAANTLARGRLCGSNINFRDRMCVARFNEEEIRRCFSVLRLIADGLTTLKENYQAYIVEYTKAQLPTKDTDFRGYINALAQSIKRFSHLTTSMFDNHQEFVEIMNQTLSGIVNERPDDRLARYADAVLRKGGQDGESNIDNLSTVLHFLSQLECFERPYQLLLTKRLLGRVTPNVDNEKLVCEEMRGIIGAEHLQKLTRMVMDIYQSSDETKKFQKEHPSSFKNVEFLILQQNAWPVFAVSETFGPSVALPALTTINLFSEYYTTKLHEGRKLTWAPSLSTVDVRLTYLDKHYTATMTFVHYDIISCFEGSDSRTLNEISFMAKLKMEAVKKYLKALIEQQLLLVENNEDIKDVTDGSTKIYLNLNLSRKNSRLRLPILFTNRTSTVDIRPESTAPENNQRIQIECAIVRIMKQQKTLKHVELVSGVIEAVHARFTPPVVMIKQSIESLIERGYLERTGEIDEYKFV